LAVSMKGSKIRAFGIGDLAETGCQCRAAVYVNDSRFHHVASRDRPHTDCQGRVAVMIKPVSAKREFFGNGPETFGDFIQEVGATGFWRLSATCKSPNFRACATQVVNSRKLREWLAGAAGIELMNSLCGGCHTPVERKRHKLPPS